MPNHHGLAVALRALQQTTRMKFGMDGLLPAITDTGAATISISASRIELTDLGDNIVAKGPVAVAKYLSTKKRGSGSSQVRARNGIAVANVTRA